jgi:hypothetical protein
MENNFSGRRLPCCAGPPAAWLAGTVLTIDARRCQREIASRVIEKKADYVLAVKDN